MYQLSPLTDQRSHLENISKMKAVGLLALSRPAHRSRPRPPPLFVSSDFFLSPFPPLPLPTPTLTLTLTPNFAGAAAAVQQVYGG